MRARTVWGRWWWEVAEKQAAYLDEMAFRCTNRENQYVFRDAIRALIGAQAMRYQDLMREKAWDSTLRRRRAELRQ